MFRIASSQSSDGDGSASNEELSEDWRSFRNKLVSGRFGLKEAEDAEKKEPVAKKNEALLRLQNPVLADEYANGAWAHSTPGPETGGLLVRRPFEAQILSKKGPWRTKIMEAAKKDFLRSTQNLDKSTGSYKIGSESSEASQARFEAWTSNSAYMFRLTERIVKSALNRIVKALQEKPRKTPVKPEDVKLIQLFQNYSENWQEVCLVVDYSPSEGASAVVINRPLSQGLPPQHAAVMFGGKPCLEALLKKQPFPDQDKFLRFATAFGSGAVYNGGPLDQEERGLLVHGVDRVHSSTARAFQGEVELKEEEWAAAEAAVAAAEAEVKAARAEADAAAAQAAGLGSPLPPPSSHKGQLRRLEKRRQELTLERASFLAPPSKELGWGCRIYQAQGPLALATAAESVLLGNALTSPPASLWTATNIASGEVTPSSSSGSSSSSGISSGSSSGDDGGGGGGSAVLDYRLFIGRKRWGPGELEKEVAATGGMWQCAATSRPLALKQCLGLPKPLWHEVMETIGGECAELSKFEFIRRSDLSDEDDDEDDDDDEDGDADNTTEEEPEGNEETS